MELKRRAIRDDQKELRRQALVDSAWQLFQASEYPAISMADVAERAGLAKGTLYLYFKTKEELFLAVQAQQFQLWMDDLDARLAGVLPPAGVDQIAALICGSLARRARLISLLAILHTVLEHNIDIDTALRFKQMLRERLARTGALLEGALPALGDGPAALLQIYALIIGVENLATPAPVVREVLRQPGMELFDIAFEPAFAAILAALLRGLVG